MKTKLMLAAALAVVGATVANAAVVGTYNPGDLIVGFQTSGAANNLEIDLGQFSTLLNNSTFDFGNVNGALGTAGLSLNGVQFSVFASQGAVGQVVNGTTFLPDALFLTQTTAPDTLGFSSSQGYGTPISSIGVGLQGQTALGSTGILAGAASIPTSFASSYTAQNLVALIPNLEGTGSSSSNVSLELYQLNSTQAAVAGSKGSGTPQGPLLVTDLGSITLSSSGELTFAAIPEPSTYAMILGVATLGFAAIRRRKQTQLLA